MEQKIGIDQIPRNLLIWLNTYPDLPVSVMKYDTNLPADSIGMVMSPIQASNNLRKDILGNVIGDGEYQFKLIYRIKPGTSNDKRIQADELLSNIGIWAMDKKPYIGENLSVVEISATVNATSFGMYENGDEDHQILMKLTYEVI